MTDTDATEAHGGTDGNADGDRRETADRVVVSYPADLSGWGRHQIDQPHFRASFLKRHDPAVGDVVEEFVGVGCCGDTLDVPMRIERVEGGDRLGPETDLEYELREACGVEGGWRVQSGAGPR